MSRLFLLLLSTVLVACSSAPKPDFEIEKQTLHKRINAEGQPEFAFVVTVKSTPRMDLAKNKPISKKELKKFADYQRVEESPELKLVLEDTAVTLLQQALKADNYCQSGYNIDNVYWRQRSVQLRGHCL
ncbi:MULTISPECIES: hypothetical protein [Pseudoalteromonas]|uniref:Lipoprotein n=1 Tax=Pseudoalteromonas obscura TaxID=3048491 RepID=A0ABT7EUG6_9GAMM|nr:MULTISPECIES: hypothetical protein [Pseudoalteromonas]MBQ4837403.1 hypothetical protein [Pseudoalteromonas luteoviolacea]MDK2598702.1 hypothetical protein [Pseudoalteromonas sp. P94(2023)]